MPKGRVLQPKARRKRAPGRPGKSREDLREQILQAASDLFAERGFDRTTMRRVADRAGVDPALIYHYFPNKEELFMERFRRDFTHLHEEPSELDIEGDNIGERIVLRFVEAREREGPHGALLSLLRSATTRSEAATVLRRFIEETVPGSVKKFLRGWAEERVALVSAQLLGLALSREILHVQSLQRLSASDLSRIYGPRITETLRSPLHLTEDRVPSRRASTSGRGPS